MNRHGSLAVGAVFVLGLLLLWGSGLALAGEASPPEPSSPEWKKNLPFDLTGEVEGGLLVVQPRGNASSSSTGESSTFDEYRDLPRTDHGGWWGHLFQVPSFRLNGEDRAHTMYLEMGGTDVTRMDANYYLNAGRYNYLRFNFEFDRLPHDISNTAQTFFTESGPGNFTIQGGAGLAAALNGVATNPATLAQRAAVIAAVNPLLGSTELGFQTDNARFGLSWFPLPELELSAGYTRTMRDGHVPWGALIGSPGSNVVELAGTRDETFNEVKAGAEYVRDWYQLRFNYTFSQFENNVDQIEWANPCGGGAGGCRNPSGLGRYSTMPNNYANTFSGAAAVNLPWWRTRLTGGFSYGMWRQNETFLPWTTVAGFTGNTTDAGANSPDAKMNIVNASLGLTTRPLRNVSATTRYRYYELQNDLPDATFTNVLNPGDQTPAAVNNTHETEPISFTRQTAGQDIAWQIIPQVMVKGLYEWDHWNRFDREAQSTNEQSFGGVVDVRPLSWILGRFRYVHSVKTIHAGGYEPLGGNATALPQFRKFDEADRTRNRGDVLLQITPIDTLTVSGTFDGQDDDYFNSPYGLQKAQSWGYSADVQWAPIERVSLFVGYAYDEYNSQEQSCNIPTAPPTPCNPTGVDNFSVRPRDTLYTVRAGTNIAVIPKRLDVSLGYTWSYGVSKQGTAGVPGGLASGDPADVPNTKNALQIFNVVGSYYLTPQWTLKLGYQYERYSETDFTTDGIAPPLAALPVSALAQADARSIILGAQHPPYEVHIVAFSLTYKF